ncbi:ion transporter [Pedobacter sp. Leaf132]|uniref:ion transporter n=1 Tax=Pedobacter sp. Leaf132 TaxID=2876557 RepID=UPI00351D7C46
MTSCGKKIYIIILRSDTRAGKLFDVVLLVLILLSILSVFLESVSAVRERYYQLIHILERIFTILLTLEYLLRIYASHKPLRYISVFTE